MLFQCYSIFLFAPVWLFCTCCAAYGEWPSVDRSSYTAELMSSDRTYTRRDIALPAGRYELSRYEDGSTLSILTGCFSTSKFLWTVNKVPYGQIVTNASPCTTENRTYDVNFVSSEDAISTKTGIQILGKHGGNDGGQVDNLQIQRNPYTCLGPDEMYHLECSRISRAGTNYTLTWYEISFDGVGTSTPQLYGAINRRAFCVMGRDGNISSGGLSCSRWTNRFAGIPVTAIRTELKLPKRLRGTKLFACEFTNHDLHSVEEAAIRLV
ncbi:b149.20 [miniopterid betaherpesvirus 1]|uniref:B149.20 n=1 Tax=miniopterid betaherpesvirus 1 TaxID=3070189 RepID=I3VQE9_9BETA|nr:b149.20 [miniopterid betaherpesvirus 1]AFK83993.1 b149.20 [miniopterid betaherpesvirus 1]